MVDHRTRTIHRVETQDSDEESSPSPTQRVAPAPTNRLYLPRQHSIENVCVCVHVCASVCVCDSNFKKVHMMFESLFTIP